MCSCPSDGLLLLTANLTVVLLRVLLLLLWVLLLLLKMLVLLHQGRLLLEDVGGEGGILRDSRFRHLNKVPPGTFDPVEKGVEFDALAVILELDVVARRDLRTKADAGDHGHDPAVEIFGERQIEVADNDPDHIGHSKDCVRHRASKLPKTLCQKVP